MKSAMPPRRQTTTSARPRSGPREPDRRGETGVGGTSMPPDGDGPGSGAGAGPPGADGSDGSIEEEILRLRRALRWGDKEYIAAHRILRSARPPRIAREKNFIET